MARGKADFRARREMLGLTQQDVADALNANVKTIKNWENPRQTRYRISDAAWEYLDRAADINAWASKSSSAIPMTKPRHLTPFADSRLKSKGIPNC